MAAVFTMSPPTLTMLRPQRLHPDHDVPSRWSAVRRDGWRTDPTRRIGRMLKCAPPATGTAVRIATFPVSTFV